MVSRAEDNRLRLIVFSRGVLMEEKAKAIVPALKLFEIYAGRCDVDVGDPVIAETTVGKDFTTRKPVQVGCAGVVEAVNWSADDHALFVWVRPCQAPGADHSLSTQ